MTLSTEASQKLNRILAIRESMEALERELDQLLGYGGPRPLSVRDKAVEIDNKSPRKYMHKKPRTCKLCGEEGHRRDTCPRGQSGAKTVGAVLNEEQYRKVKDMKAQGHRVAEIVAKTGFPADPVNKAYMAGSFGIYLNG